MKKLFLAIAVAILLAGCSGNTESGSQEPARRPSESVEEPQIAPLTEDEIKRMYSSPEDYIGRTVELVGQVFAGVDYDEDGVYFQMWADAENFNNNTVVAYLDPSFTVEDNQYVRVKGTVADVLVGENMMGATVTAPLIRADELAVLTYKEAVMPTIAVAEATTKTIEQRGYSVTVQTVELAEEETRAYISVTNNGSSTFSLYEFNMLLIQDGTQYEYTWNFMADYPELQTDIRPGITSEGVVVFPAIKEAPFQIIMEGDSGDWNEELEEYIFDFNISEKEE
ncbi:hypothetical protein DWX58_05055 [Pseudoflavonifractor sp. AF19-9AC]|uniref:hypothetical protein n=1 Tax=Pseudoflavonifractor sp. AF19-9AC TaxID=2292244 RepID=UPI000E4A6BED|nr:hypothetical protein [Pseudoflavonifractor sp. AF19-9AC]RHR10753.1 hypothetical protein DWX58_05055 [Pseudoflavonifractor sp. AF19-9AC]